MNNMSYKAFSEINIDDSFFDSLKGDYPCFLTWFQKKRDQNAYVQYNEAGKIEGFLYLKIERNVVDDVDPVIYADKILKVGTFKIDSHGTRLGERFIKIIMDNAVNENVDICYVTIYPKYNGLIRLVEEFGFEEYGIKGKEPYSEKVFVKNMRVKRADLNKQFPIVDLCVGKNYLLSIYPQYHSVMFPDSILTTENENIITDISYTNSIHKIYVCSMDVDVLKYGDKVVIYRTAEQGKSAEYSSVVTSICVVEEVRNQSEFESFDEFYDYASQYSVFDKRDLYKWYRKGRCKAIKMTYNAALKKRIVRHDLANTIGLDRDMYWGFFELTENEFSSIIELGGVESHIIMN